MEGEKVLRYYRLRFQIEFLIRDAKIDTGLDHFQGRSEEKLYNHFNMAMMNVSVVKYQTWGQAARQGRGVVFNAQHKNGLLEPVHDPNNIC